ncbi:hypothetical protein [Streptomyces sp. NPDC046925]|uniref:DUF7691 family protein n=1 Tax=Streptomyces sp. NPDC046925 TaxID=3155375 RepID=UPI0033C79099
MSSSLSVYLLDIAATRALIGSRDQQLLAVIRDKHGAELARDDDEFSFAIEEEGAPTAFEALTAVVNGGPFSDDPDHAFQYGYAYLRLCDVTGSFLNNNCFTPHRGNWLADVDTELSARGITAVATEDFFFGTPPDSLPQGAETPDSGEWTHEQCTKALAQYEAAQLIMDEGRQTADLEPGIDRAVEQCIGWIRHAAARPGYGIIGFHF